MSCVVIVLRNVLEVVACTAPRFWHRKCRYPQIREFMPVPQVPQFLVYRYIFIFIGPKYILTYHPHTFDPQGLSQPRIYTSNSPCPRSGRAVRGSQLLYLIRSLISTFHISYSMTVLYLVCVTSFPSKLIKIHQAQVN